MQTNQDAAKDRIARPLVTNAIKNQYHASLAMLVHAIELCPHEFWVRSDGANPFWRIAYHALFYTDLYLREDDTSFTPRAFHQTGLQDLDDIPATPDLQELLELPTRPPQTGIPFSKAQLLEYAHWCDGMIDGWVDACDLGSPVSGFRWHMPPRSKLEHHVMEIRHLQHHAAQLSGLVHVANGAHVEWVGANPPRTSRRTHISADGLAPLTPLSVDAGS